MQYPFFLSENFSYTFTVLLTTVLTVFFTVSLPFLFPFSFSFFLLFVAFFLKTFLIYLIYFISVNDQFSHFSIQKKLFVGLTTLFLLLGGIYAMMTLPIDAVPDITNNQVQIVTVSPTLAPQEVEQLITMPIEIAMSNIMNVEEIRSVSRFGLSLVTVVFKESVPTLDARQKQKQGCQPNE